MNDIDYTVAPPSPLEMKRSIRDHVHRELRDQDVLLHHIGIDQFGFHYARSGTFRVTWIKYRDLVVRWCSVHDVDPMPGESTRLTCRYGQPFWIVWRGSPV